MANWFRRFERIEKKIETERETLSSNSFKRRSSKEKPWPTESSSPQ
jgi:hypothetical protein